MHPATPSPVRPESAIARATRQRREAKAAAAAAPSTLLSAVSPSSVSKLKRPKGRTITVEVEKPPLLVSIAALTPHPLLGRSGMLPDIISRETALGLKASGSKREDHQARAARLARNFSGMVESIVAHGLLEPLKVVASLTGYLIAEGRHRWAACAEIAANEQGNPAWETAAAAFSTAGIPCVEISPEAVPGVILGSLNNRYLTKQARALTAVSLYPSVAEESKSGRPKKELGNDYPIIRQDDLATQIGVSLETMKDACLFWRELALKPAARRETLMEQVFAGISFANALIGAIGAEKTAGVTPEPAAIGGHLLKTANAMRRHFGHYGAMTREAQLAYLTALIKAVAVAPPEVRHTLLSCLTAA